MGQEARRGQQRLWRARIRVDPRGRRDGKKVSGSANVARVSVRNDQEASGGYRGLVLNDGVLRNANGGQSAAQCGESAADQCALDRRNDPAREHYWANARDNQHRRAEHHAPNRSPEGAELAPRPHPIPRINEAYGMLLGLIVLAENAQVPHVVAVIAKPLDRHLSLFVGRKNGHGMVGEGWDFDYVAHVPFSFPYTDPPGKSAACRP